MRPSWALHLVLFVVRRDNRLLAVDSFMPNHTLGIDFSPVHFLLSPVSSSRVMEEAPLPAGRHTGLVGISRDIVATRENPRSTEGTTLMLCSRAFSRGS